ncbi:right-handed parallel beta-helix repeat-containing protein [Candidatus Woesearchaeota archaeon]|nr:right-handed parallel beta-helix repeat-containing protein [Candidatus Woesearchaeota archaeon]
MKKEVLLYYRILTILIVITLIALYLIHDAKITGMSFAMPEKSDIVISSNFKIKIDIPLPFIPDVQNNTEIKYLGYKHSNNSNIIVSVKDYISCNLDSDSSYDGWKNCIVIFEVQNDNTEKPSLLSPSITLNYSDYSNIRNIVISFSNTSSLINETSTSWILISDPAQIATDRIMDDMIIENTSIFQKRNFTNFESLPSVIVTETPFALKVNYESSSFNGNYFNLSISTLNFNGFIDPDQSACGTLSTENAKYTLTQSVSSTGTCFTIGANNIVLDCNGYIVNYSTNGISNNYGVDNGEGYDNITIENCNIFEGNGTTTQRGKPGIYFLNVDNSTIIFNNLTTEGNFSDGLILNISNLNNVSFNIFNVSSGNNLRAGGANGISLKSSANNTISNNIIFSNSTNDGIRLDTSDYNLIQYNLINGTGTRTGGRNIRCQDSNYNIIYSNTLSAIQNFQGLPLFLLRCSNTNVSYNNMLVIDGNQSMLLDISDSGGTLAAANNTFLSNTYKTTIDGMDTDPFFKTAIRQFSGTNNTFINERINAPNVPDILVMVGNLTFLNVTFNRSDITFISGTAGRIGNGTITVKWYTQVNLSNYINQGLSNGNITAFNASFVLEDSSNNTLNNGQATRLLELTEYQRNISSIFYNTPHQINVSRLNYDENYTIINLTNIADPTNFIVQIYMVELNPPSITISSSAGTDFYEDTTTTLTCTTSDPNGIRSMSMDYENVNICSSSSQSCSGEFSPQNGIIETICTANDVFGNAASKILNLNVAKRFGTASPQISSGEITSKHISVINDDKTITELWDETKELGEENQRKGSTLNITKGEMNPEKANNKLIKEVYEIITKKINKIYSIFLILIIFILVIYFRYKKSRI